MCVYDVDAIALLCVAGGCMDGYGVILLAVRLTRAFWPNDIVTTLTQHPSLIGTF